MQITGRVTADAQVHTVKENKQVVNFTVAVNDSYKNKSGKWVNLTEYFRCAYWLTSKIAKSLTKGSLVELTGRTSANAWTTSDGEARASLNFHTSQIKFHDKAKSQEASETTQDRTEGNKGDDLPF